MKPTRTIVVFGGAFDPIHITHIDFASALDAFYRPHEVWFLPAPKPRWKSTTTPFHVRRRDIQLAIQSHPHWKVPLIEYQLQKHQQETFTISTLREIKRRHPQWHIIFAMGSDQFMKFHLWHEADAFKDVCELAVIQRPGYHAPDHFYTVYQATRIPMNESTIASATIRATGAYDSLPPVVCQRIIASGRYFDERVSSRLSKTRMEHVRRVAQLAVRLAKAHGVSTDDAYVAAILHDIAREIPTSEARHFLAKKGTDASHLEHAQVHAYHGAWLAEHEFGVTNPSILDAIRFHTHGDPSMDKLAKIIYCADKCEAGRGKYTRPLRRLCLQDLDQGLLATLQADVDYWRERGSLPDHHPVLQLIQHLQKEK